MDDDASCNCPRGWARDDCPLHGETLIPRPGTDSEQRLRDAIEAAEAEVDRLIAWCDRTDWGNILGRYSNKVGSRELRRIKAALAIPSPSGREQHNPDEYDDGTAGYGINR